MPISRRYLQTRAARPYPTPKVKPPRLTSEQAKARGRNVRKPKSR